MDFKPGVRLKLNCSPWWITFELNSSPSGHFRSVSCIQLHCIPRLPLSSIQYHCEMHHQTWAGKRFNYASWTTLFSYMHETDGRDNPLFYEVLSLYPTTYGHWKPSRKHIEHSLRMWNLWGTGKDETDWNLNTQKVESLSESQKASDSMSVSTLNLHEARY